MNITRKMWIPLALILPLSQYKKNGQGHLPGRVFDSFFCYSNLQKVASQAFLRPSASPLKQGSMKMHSIAIRGIKPHRRLTSPYATALSWPHQSNIVRDPNPISYIKISILFTYFDLSFYAVFNLTSYWGSFVGGSY